MSEVPAAKEPTSEGPAPGGLLAGVAAADLTPRREYAPIETVENDDLTRADMFALITAKLAADGLVGDNTEGFNELLDHGLNKIMETSFQVRRTHQNLRESEPHISHFLVELDFSEVQVGKPTCTEYITGQISPHLPASARVTGLPYTGAVTLSAAIGVTANFRDGRTETRRVEIPNVHIGNFPIMVGSKACHTHHWTREARKAAGEDPLDRGGYFLVKRGEYAITLGENLRFNSISCYREMRANERVRAEILSQPGGAFENSSQLRLRFSTGGSISVEINSQRIERAKIPFYIIYRLFGMMSDRDVCRTVVYDVEDTSPTTLQMLTFLERAFFVAEPSYEGLMHVTDHALLVQRTAEIVTPYITSRSTFKANEAAVQYMTQDLMRTLDRVVLPHIGQGPDSRAKKLRFLGLMIRNALLVWMGVLPPTDRDSYSNKRVHGAAISLAKAFKTQVNNNVIGPISRAIHRELKGNDWEGDGLSAATFAEIFRGALASTNLEKAMEQAISSGNKTVVVSHRAATNRVPSQVAERKSWINFVSMLRTVTCHNTGNSAKQTKRAMEMRMPHPSMAGFVCPSQSADTGEKVGMLKQLSLGAGVCLAVDALPLKLCLLADPEVTPLERVESPRGLAAVFVNGEPIGYCRSAHALADRYRRLRREQREVHPFTTVYWDVVLDAVEFWLDVGRLYRPLLIVDNNLEAYDAAREGAAREDAAREGAAREGAAREGAAPTAPPVPFVQNTRFTKAHVRAIRAGRLSLAQLVAEGVAEYITPEEQQNCLVAESIDVLRSRRHDVTRRYTHVEVEQLVFGLAALLSPFGNHTQPARVTYETNQGRQSGGWYALNWPARVMDMNRFFQWRNQVPAVSTVTTGLVPSNGLNVMIAYVSCEGDNQEDSAVVCRASSERGMFEGVFFRREIAERERNEEFRTPDPVSTKGMRPDANYEKLVDGFIARGSVVNYGDVLIGRVVRNPRGGAAGAGAADAQPYTDRSVIYRLHEPATVEETLSDVRGANDEIFGVVRLRYERPLRVGDKLSSRSGNKSIVAKMLPQCDMPFTDEGITPDIMINTHSFPSRMTIGQLIEGVHGDSCAARGCTVDGTSFLPASLADACADLARLGLRFNGRRRLYDGKTGQFLDAAIFIAPTFEQRLTKFVLDDEQAVAGSGPTDALTGQPLAGKHVQGGLRHGEMEGWTAVSHGSLLNFHEKTSVDSDGRTVHVCRCGYRAVYNKRQGIYACRTCGELADISEVDSCKSATLLSEMLATASIDMRIGLAPREL